MSADLLRKPYENMWVLKTDDNIPNLTWWWIFFVRDPERPGSIADLRDGNGSIS